MATITATVRENLIGIYMGMFKKAPGADALSEMVQMWEANKTQKQIAAELAKKPAFNAEYPALQLPSEFADEVVAWLASEASSSGKSWATNWIIGKVNAGVSKSDIIVEAVLALRVATNTADFGNAKANLNNKVDVGLYYAVTKDQKADSATIIDDVTSAAASVTAAKTEADGIANPPPAGQTFTLTANLDSLTGASGNDTFNSLSGAALLTALDTLDGGDGTDQLVVKETGAMSIPATVSIKNIESASLTSGATVTANTSTWTGLTALSSTSAGGATLTAAASTDVTATDVAATTTLAISGGNAVTATVTGTAGAITIDGSAGAVTVSQATAGAITIGGTTAVKGSVTVTDTAQGNAAIAIDGGTSVTVTNTTTGTGTVTIGGTTAPTGAVTVNETLKGTGALAGGAIQVTGGTSVNVSIAASQATNNATTTVGAVTVTGKATTTEVTVAGTAVATAAATVAAVTESNVATFVALGKGASLTVGGLTFLAGSAGTTAAQTAAAFANLANGATSGASTLGTYSGALSGWSTGAVSTADVTFTSATAGSNVTDLAQVTTGQTAAGVTFVKTDGVAAAGKGGITANSVTVTDAVGAASAAETTASSIASVTAHHYTTLSVDSNALSSLSLLAGSGNISIANASARASKTTTLGLTLNGVTGGTLDDENVYTTLNVTTTGAASTLADITDTALATLTVAGDKLLTLTSAAGMTALKTVTVSGAAGLKADLSALVAGGSVNTSASTGTSTITVDASVATYTGGSGVDAVTTAAATAISKAIDLGAGDDTLTVGAGLTGVTAAVSGGDGIDTLVMSTSDADAYDADAGVLSKISGFEKLTLSGAVAGKSVDVSAYGPANSITMTATASTTLTKVAAGATITIAGAQAGTLTVTGADVTGKADSLNLVQTNAIGGTVDAAGYETVNLTSSVASGVITLKDAAATTLNISGTKSTIVTLDAANVALTTIDASANTGGVTITSVATKAATITGGSGNDALTAATGTTADVLIGGAGNDTLTSNAGLNTLTGGAGFDMFVIGAAGSSKNTYSTITDAAAGDMLTLAANKGTETFAATKLTLADTATFADYVNLAAAGDGSTHGALSWFQYGGNTYVVEDLSAGATFVDGTDVVVRLTGLVDLSNARLAGAAGNELVIG